MNALQKNRIFCWTLLLAMVMTGGCGKKAPPVPPKTSVQERIRDISVTKENETALLSWAVPAAGTGADEYIVFRSKVATDIEPCGPCPEVFEPVAEVPAEEAVRVSGGTYRLIYSEMLDAGHRYTYKVAPFWRRTGRGPFSDPVLIVH